MMSMFMTEPKIILAGLCLAAGLLAGLISPPTAEAGEKITVGFIEEVIVVPGNISLAAKIDTGADNSSLHATAIMRITRKGQKWVRFRVRDENGRRHIMERPLVRMTGIRQDDGPRDERPVVSLVICLGGVAKKAQVNLNDRSNYKYKMLVGRSFLQDSFLVDCLRQVFDQTPMQGDARAVSKRHLYLLAFILAAVGLGIFVYKAVWLNFPVTPQERSHVWNVEAMIKFEAGGGPVKVSMAIPTSTRRFAIMDEQFVSRAYGLNTAEEDGDRRAVWSVRKAQGGQTIYYRAVILRSLVETAPAKVKPPTLPEAGFKGAVQEAAKALLSTVQARSADLDTFVAQLFERLNNPRPGTNLPLLLGKRPTKAKKVELAVRLLSLAKIPARSVHGLRLTDEQRRAPLLHWIEIFDGKSWRGFDPQNGRAEIPADYLVWWRGASQLTKSEGAKRTRVGFSVTHNLEISLGAAVLGSKKSRTKLLQFSLFSLPLSVPAGLPRTALGSGGGLYSHNPAQPGGPDHPGHLHAGVDRHVLQGNQAAWGRRAFLPGGGFGHGGQALHGAAEAFGGAPPGRRTDRGHLRHGRLEHHRPPVGGARRAVRGAFPHGHPHHDHRAHVHSLGRARTGPGANAGGRQPNRRIAGLLGHEHRGNRAPGFRIPGAYPGAFGRHLDSGQILRLPAFGAEAV